MLLDATLAILTGIAAFIGTNIVINTVRAFACGASQFMIMILQYSYLALPIRMAGWFAASWAGFAAFDAVYGF